MDLFIDELVKTVLLALVPVVAGLVVSVLVRLFQRIGLQLSAENQARTEKLVHDAIFFAEEKVASAIKRGVKPVDTKLQTAVKQVLDKIPGITQDEAIVLITAELPKLGLGTAGFARSVVTAATNDTK